MSGNVFKNTNRFTDCVAYTKNQCSSAFASQPNFSPLVYFTAGAKFYLFVRFILLSLRVHLLLSTAHRSGFSLKAFRLSKQNKKRLTANSKCQFDKRGVTRHFQNNARLGRPPSTRFSALFSPSLFAESRETAETH